MWRKKYVDVYRDIRQHLGKRFCFLRRDLSLCVGKIWEADRDSDSPLAHWGCAVGVWKSLPGWALKVSFYLAVIFCNSQPFRFPLQWPCLWEGARSKIFLVCLRPQRLPQAAPDLTLKSEVGNSQPFPHRSWRLKQRDFCCPCFLLLFLGDRLSQQLNKSLIFKSVAILHKVAKHSTRILRLVSTSRF